MKLVARLGTAPAAAAAIAIVLSAASARAGDEAAAEALYRTGRDAAKREDWAHACAAFEESFRLDPAPGVALNLGDCEEHLGKLASAWQYFVRARDRFPPTDERRAYAERRVKAIEPRVPKLTVVVTDAAPDFVLLRDGVELGAGAAGVALPIDPGPHKIVLRVQGHLDAARDVSLAEGQAQKIDLAPGPFGPTPASAPPPSAAPATAPATPGGADDPARGRKTIGIALGGAGAVALVTGVVTGILVVDRASTYRAHCNADNVCDSDGLSAARQGHTFEIVSPIALGIGAAALAAGAILYFAPSPRAGAQIGVALGPGTAGLRASF